MVRMLGYGIRRIVACVDIHVNFEKAVLIKMNNMMANKALTVKLKKQCVG